MRRALVRNAAAPVRPPVLALIALGLLALAGCDGGADNKAAAAPPPPEVTVAHPRVEKLVEWTEFTGRFEAVQQVDIRARVQGYLQQIDFRDGQLVEHGPEPVPDRSAPLRGGAGTRPAPISGAPRRSSSSPSWSQGSPS